MRNGFRSKQIPLFCKTCGSRRVYWDKKFDEKGFQKFKMMDSVTNLPHVCSVKDEDIMIRHKI